MIILHRTSPTLRILGIVDIICLAGVFAVFLYGFWQAPVAATIGLLCATYWTWKATLAVGGFWFPVIFGLGSDGVFLVKPWSMWFNSIIMLVLFVLVIDALIFYPNSTLYYMAALAVVARLTIPQMLFGRIISKELS